MDERIRKPGNRDIAGKRNLLVWKINDQIAARVRRREMEQFEAHTLNRERFFFLYNFRGKVIAQIDVLRIAAGILHLLFAVLLSNDGQALGEARKTVYMIEIAVSEDYMGHGLGRELCDFCQQSPPRLRRLLGVNDNHPVLADDGARI